MASASVGFQCPECVKEGHRSVRQPKRFTSARIGFRALPVTLSLIGVNVLVWLSIVLTGGHASRVVGELALFVSGYCRTPGSPTVPPTADPVGVCTSSGFDWVTVVGDNAWWQVITSTFTHVEILHIAANMLSLYMLGSFLEPVLGRWRFLVFYLVSGLAGSTLVLWAGQIGSTVGASGAIFGLLGIIVVLFLRAGQSLAPLLPVLLINGTITFWPGLGISWQAHVGGFVGGLVVAWLFTTFRADRKARMQWATVTAFALVLLALVGVRILLF
ncbi:rhomboid family intramembrane serine protease [Nocardioides sp. NPDC126508]